jgi:hypothetical protein
MSKTNNRNAEQSYKGYTFQRARLINLLFCKHCHGLYDENNKNIKFKEEGLEDIDIYIINDQGKETINSYQEKYLSSTENESITKDSGLTKVLKSHYLKHDKISEINYEVFSPSVNKGTNILNFLFDLADDEKNNNLLGKFIVINYCKPNFLKQNYIEQIQDFKEDLLDLIEEKNFKDKKLNDFLTYCADEKNIDDLIVYINKINYRPEKRQYIDLYDETIDKLKTLLPEFNNLFVKFKEFKHFYAEMMYGFFETIIVENLFKNNDEMSLKDLIDIFKEKINNFTTEDQSISMIIYGLFLMKRDQLISSEEFGDLDSLAKFMKKYKYGLENLVINLKNESKIYRELLRKIIKKLCKCVNCDIFEEPKILFFLAKTHDEELLKLKGNSYRSLKDFDVKYFGKTPKKIN